MNLQKVTLPLLILDVEHNDQKQALAHVLNQHDTGYVQPFILNSGDDAYDVPTEAFHFRASRPDGQIIDVDNSDNSLVEKGDQNWLLNLPTGVTETPGLVKCVVYAKDDGRVLASSQQIMYNVMPAFDVDDVNHVSYVPDLDKLKAKLTDLVGKAQEQVSRLSGITAGDKQAAEQALKEELDKLGKQAGDWLDGEKANVNNQIADIVKQSSGLDEAYKQAYKEEIGKLAGQTSKDYEAKLQAVIDKLNADKQSSLQAINDDWTKQKGSLQTDITSFKADLIKQVEAITSTVNALNTSDLPAIQSKVNSFNDALDKLNSQISSIKLDYYTKDEIDNKLDNLKAGATPDLTDLKKQVQDNAASLQSKVGKDELANYALKSDVPTAPDLAGYAKTADVNKELDTKADKTALDAYALKSELPAMPDLSAYAKVTALENYATKQALDAYALKTDLPDLTSYAKKTDLPAPVDLTGYAKKSELPDVSNLETQADHANDVKKINETLETYAKKSELPSTDNLETKADHKSDIDKLNEALDSKADKTALNNYALKTDVPASPDLSGYAKKTDLPTVPSLDGYAKTEDVDKKLDTKVDKTDLTAYETSANHKTDIDKLNEALSNKADVSAIPALPDMSQYALKTDLKNVDLTGYLTKDDADRLLGEKANESELADYAKKTDLPPVPNLTVYAKVTDVAKALNNKADKDELVDYAKTADVEKANTAATNANNKASTANTMAINANKLARMAMQNSQNAVREIQVDGGRPADKDKYGWVNLQLGLSDYLKKADADDEYAKKTDIPNTSNFVTNDSLNNELNSYALKSDLPTSSGATSIKAIKQMTINDSDSIDMNNSSNYSTYTVDSNGQINMAVDPNGRGWVPAGAFPCVVNAVLGPNNTDSDSNNAFSLANYYPSYIFKFPDGKYYLGGQQLMFSSDIPGGGKLVSQISTRTNLDDMYWNFLRPDSNGYLEIPTDGSAIFPSVLREQNPDSSTLDKMKKDSKKDGFFYVGGDGSGNDHLVAAGYELVKKEDLDALTTRVKALEDKLNG